MDRRLRRDAPPEPALLPDATERCDWYWLFSPMQSQPVVGLFVAGLFRMDGRPCWRLPWGDATPAALARRGWRIAGRCLRPDEVDALRSNADAPDRDGTP
jgi:hypothetical protein